MDNIKAPKFNNAKEQLKALSNNVPNKVTFARVDTKGTIIPWNSHNVTGEEVNRLILNIEKSLIDVNNNITPLYGEFIKVYNTFDELDKEYIQGILGAVRSANIASKQAKDASDKALRALGKAENAQNDIKKTLEALQITVTALKKFKESTTAKLNLLNELATKMGTLEKEKGGLKSGLLNLNKNFDKFTKNISDASKQFSSDIAALQNHKSQLEAYEHLGDVDAIWGNVEQHKKNLTDLHQQLDGIAKEVSGSSKQFCSDIAALQDYKSQLEAYEHLGDVDDIWGNVEQHKKNLTDLHQQLDGIAKEISESSKQFCSDIAALQDYQSQLEAYEHLRDVDAIWGDVEKHKKNLTELHQQLDGIAKEINESTKLFKSDIAVLQDYKSQLEVYEHLGDVDAVWGEVEHHKKNITELHQRLENFATEYHSDRKDIQSSIETIIEENVQSNNAINKKIRVAYIVAGFSVTMAIVQFVLNILHII